MAREIVNRTALSVRKGNVVYGRSGQAALTMTGSRGPTPGMVAVATGGTTVSLAAVGVPGVCYLKNYDAVNYVSVGVYDGTTYLPLLELGPGEEYVVKLSRTIGTSTFVLRLKADTAACNVLVETFEV